MALGVVYGDIGTSPLYALRECFDPLHHNLALTQANVLGILSLIVWSLTLVVSVQYLGFIMRADNRGEGGILSIMALALNSISERQTNFKYLISFGGLIGAALLYGDGMITPAISVLSAVEGLKVATPAFENFVVPITVAVITSLFFAQKYGTHRIGRVFGPIILIWFTTLGALGIYKIVDNPSVLVALNPYYAYRFMIENGQVGFFVLGSVFLVITGAEALYADMGHFGRKPILVGWFSLVAPGLILNYFGQGALLLSNPSAISNPFYLMAPKSLLVPLVLLSTLATVIASQALISGVFSLTRQAVQLGLFPRIRIIHTSHREIGQIYVPLVNWTLLVGVLWLVMTFQTSSSLASAYGIAVTGTMLITTVLATIVTYYIWRWKLIYSLFFLLFFGTIVMAFFIPNLAKFATGGWIPIVICAATFTLISTWQKGRKILGERMRAKSMAFQDFFKMIEDNPPTRVTGSAIYMTGDTWGVPVPMLHNLKHNKVLHQVNAILTISTKDIPLVYKSERVEIEKLGENFYRVVAHYGFMETPKIQDVMRVLEANGLDFRLRDTTFVLGRETILASGLPGMALWREKLFALMTRNAQRPTAFYNIPPEQVIEVGIQIEI